MGRDRYDILVYRGKAIRRFACKALGADTKACASFTVADRSLTIIQVKPDGACNVFAFGDTGHVPPNLLSGLTSASTAELVAP